MTESLHGVDQYDSVWYLLDYQQGRDLPREFVNHIAAGVEVAAKDPRSILIFSGGQTRADAGPRSEAQSYYFVAEHFDWWGHPAVAGRTVTEEYARDSFENLLFSLCRFTEISNGRYPSKVTVISFDFKKHRFAELHAKALRLPSFTFVPMEPQVTGTNSPLKFDKQAAIDGERITVHQFRQDPYGCGTVLAKKRQERNPFARYPPYGPHCPRLAPLLGHCGPDIFNGTLPW